MPYIDRDDAGKIKGVYACRQREGQESVAEDSPEMVNFRADQAKQEEEMAVKAALSVIDLKSIRGLREWVTKQADAPQELKDCEAQAIETRSKIAK